MERKWDILSRKKEWDFINGEWINKNTGTKYDKNGFDVEGIHKDTLTEYDPDGYDNWSRDKNGYDRNGFDVTGIHKDTLAEYDPDGYDMWGEDREGFDRNGFDREGIHKDTKDEYDPEGFDKDGYDKEEFDRDGFDKFGYNREGFNKEGYNRKGYNKEGINRAGFDKKGIHKDTLTEYDTDGYDKDGYDKEGYNIEGIDRTGKNREERNKIQKKQRATWLGLRRKAETLVKGEMTIEEYIMKSKMSIVELIEFAKKNNLSADVIRGLHRFIKPYQIYTRPFSKKEYLSSTTLIIDEKAVKPTEQDVEMCIQYLKVNGSLVCDKTVRDTVRRYLSGEIDITQKSEEATKQELIKKIVKQQETIKGQQAEISRLKDTKIL